jgi:Cu-Zn family superoxide dismutase
MASTLWGCAGIMAEDEPLSAEANIRNKDGQEVGRATLVETAEGVRVAVTAFRLPRGPKGVHIHEVGVCQPPAFASAGGHFNPTKRKHGRLHPEGPHAGDLPNLVIGASGEGGIDIVTKAVTLRPGRPNSLFGDNGTSIIIHADPDDEKTDPTGNSGARVGCGVIVR